MDRAKARSEERLALRLLQRIVLRGLLREELTLAKAAVLLALVRVPGAGLLVRICALFLGE